MKKADQRRAEIAQAAALLFERDGFHSVNVGELADAVGLSKATLYHYVESKAEIVLWIHDELIEPLLQRLEQSVEDDIDPRAGLRQVLVDTIYLMDVRPGYLRVFFENQREIPEELRAHARERRKRYEDLVIVLIERGIAQGLIRSRHPRLTAMTLLGITNWSYQWYRPGVLPPREVAEHLFELFLRGAATQEGADGPMPDMASPLTLGGDGAAAYTILSDAAWTRLQEALPTEGPRRGGQWRDHRVVLDAIGWKVRTGAPWRELPERYGPWRTVYGRLARWQADGTWGRLVEVASKDGPLRDELEWVARVPDRGSPAGP